jgi:hypothetical protein
MNVKPAFEIKEPSSTSLQKHPVHDIPLSVILMNVVDYDKIVHLPVNQDCTEVLQTACLKVLDLMFPGGGTIEEFLRQKNKFMTHFRAEIIAHSRGMWKAMTRGDIEVRIVSSNSNELRFAN